MYCWKLEVHIGIESGQVVVTMLSVQILGLRGFGIVQVSSVMCLHLEDEDREVAVDIEHHVETTSPICTPPHRVHFVLREKISLPWCS